MTTTDPAPARRACELHGVTERGWRGASLAIDCGRYAPGLRIGRHDHERASLCLVLAGAYEERYGRRTRRAVAGSLIAHPAGEAHADRHEACTTRLLTIEIDDDALRETDVAARLVDAPWHCDAVALLPLALRLRDALDASDSRDLVVADAAWRFIAAVAGHRQRDATRAPWLRAVRDRLEAGGETPTLAALAADAGVHPMHLTRAFRQAYGCSIGDHVRARRVAHAVRLLTDTRLGLATIAAEAGYADQCHFTRQVSAATGRAPGAWRRTFAAG
jgi:AraC family transcriptional regulator